MIPTQTILIVPDNVVGSFSINQNIQIIIKSTIPGLYNGSSRKYKANQITFPEFWGGKAFAIIHPSIILATN